MIPWDLAGCQATKVILSCGDSKTMTGLVAGTNLDSWQVRMQLELGCDASFNIGNPSGQSMGALARGAHTVAMMKALVDADMLAMTGPTPTHILVNLGSADLVLGMPTQEAFEADYGYYLDALHTKWPTAEIYCASPWKKNGETDSNNMHTWIGNVLSTRPWAQRGPDERVVIKGTDLGVTNLYDNLTHLSVAGVTVWSAAWIETLGW